MSSNLSTSLPERFWFISFQISSLRAKTVLRIHKGVCSSSSLRLRCKSFLWARSGFTDVLVLDWYTLFVSLVWEMTFFKAPKYLGISISGRNAARKCWFRCFSDSFLLLRGRFVRKRFCLSDIIQGLCSEMTVLFSHLLFSDKIFWALKLESKETLSWQEKTKAVLGVPNSVRIFFEGVSGREEC